MSKSKQHRLAAILAADVVGYSKLMDEDQAGTLAALRHLRRDVFAPALAEYGGSIVKSMGDGWLVEFDSIGNAVNCSMAIQQALGGDTLMQLRMGLHIGDVSFEDEDIFGNGVNVAARLQDLAPASGLLVSGDVLRQLDSEGKSNFAIVGELKLKNISEPVMAAVWPVGAAGQMTTVGKRTPVGKPRLNILEITGSGECRPIAEGIEEDLIAVLSRQSGIDYALDPGRADYTIRGVLRGDVNRVRVNIHLLDNVAKVQVWSMRFEIGSTDPFAIQDVAVQRISSGVRTFVWEQEGRKAASRPIAVLTQDELLALGSHHFAKQTVASFLTAKEVMDRVLEKETENFMALAMSVLGIMGPYFYGYAAPPSDLIELAKSRSVRAVQLNGGSDFAHYIQANVDIFINQEYEGAILACNRALEINPNFSFAKFTLGLAHAMNGDYDKGIANIEEVLSWDLDNPYSPVFLSVKGYALIAREDYPLAKSTFAQADKMLPGTPRFLLGLAIAQGLGGDEAAGRRTVGKIIDAVREIHVGEVCLPPFRDREVIDRMRMCLIAVGLPE